MKIGPHRFILRSFETTQAVLPFDIQVDLVCQATELQVVYHLKGPLSHLKISSAQIDSDFKAELWKTTCFELFLKKANTNQYMEWNFSPNRDWWACHFDNYRKAKPPNERQFSKPKIFEEITDTEMKFSVQILRPVDYALCGLACVLEHKDPASKSHWALDHFGEKPDFHDFRSFLITLD